MTAKRYKTGYSFGGRDEGSELEHLIAHELDGNDYDTGQLEAAAATGRNCTEAIGRLVAVLHRRGALTLAEVAEVIGCSELEEVEPPPPPTPAPITGDDVIESSKRRTWDFDAEGKVKP